MRCPKVVLLLCTLILFLQACCCMDCESCHSRSKACAVHPEPPFVIPSHPPGSGLVWGTVDFVGSSQVLLKFQVEDVGVSDKTAQITAWAGNGDYAPTSVPTGTPFYDSVTEVPLRTWTSHIERNTDNTGYWVWVRVDYKDGTSSSIQDRRLWWDPANTTSPDTVHELL